ncbi:hypothetical protein ROP_04940 [Rhodococcus opacus B4]|uniref:Uncharacterized protein n=1 Tax=Rhodococcus opacus (strain B4) TaxID=632772 RepID=C1ARR4_RHOOB|nr:hypothetical protein ROP_04940 [Rhodococcus opacus B4]
MIVDRALDMPNPLGVSPHLASTIAVGSLGLRATTRLRPLLGHSLWRSRSQKN